MIIRSAIFIVMILLIGVSGCVMPAGERRNSAALQRAEIEGLKTDLCKLKTLVDESETARQRLNEDFESLKASMEKDRRELKDRLGEIERSLKAAEVARGKLKQEIIADLSNKMAEIMRSRASRSSRVEEGYKHVVQSGETLSEIAQKYGTTVDAILSVNKLKNANAIKEGETLFIPE